MSGQALWSQRTLPPVGGAAATEGCKVTCLALEMGCLPDLWNDTMWPLFPDKAIVSPIGAKLLEPCLTSHLLAEQARYSARGLRASPDFPTVSICWVDVPQDTESFSQLLAFMYQILLATSLNSFKTSAPPYLYAGALWAQKPPLFTHGPIYAGLHCSPMLSIFAYLLCVGRGGGGSVGVATASLWPMTETAGHT